MMKFTLMRCRPGRRGDGRYTRKLFVCDCVCVWYDLIWFMCTPVAMLRILLCVCRQANWMTEIFHSDFDPWEGNIVGTPTGVCGVEVGDKIISDKFSVFASSVSLYRHNIRYTTMESEYGRIWNIPRFRGSLSFLSKRLWWKPLTMKMTMTEGGEGKKSDFDKDANAQYNLTCRHWIVSLNFYVIENDMH